MGDKKSYIDQNFTLNRKVDTSVGWLTFMAAKKTLKVYTFYLLILAE